MVGITYKLYHSPSQSVPSTQQVATDTALPIKSRVPDTTSHMQEPPQGETQHKIYHTSRIRTQHAIKLAHGYFTTCTSPVSSDTVANMQEQSGEEELQHPPPSSSLAMETYTTCKSQTLLHICRNIRPDRGAHIRGMIYLRYCTTKGKGL